MNIILEGPDAGGKSTLADILGRRLGMVIIKSKGPDVREEDFHRRCQTFFKYHQVIFDRHPCISELVYSRVLSRPCMLTSQLINEFHRGRHFIIYVRPQLTTSLFGHVVKPSEDPDHVRNVAVHYPEICQAYDEYMLHHANYIYRIGDNLSQLIKAVS